MMKQISSGSILFILLLLWTHTYAAELKLPAGLIQVANRPAPAFSLANMDGKKYQYTPASGNWSFVHFWASWCGPCRKEIPALQNMSNKLQDSPLNIVIINTAEDEDTVFSFLGGVAPELNTLLDRDGLVTEQWQPRGLPSTYLVDPQGQIRYIALGGRPWDETVYINFLEALISK